MSAGGPARGAPSCSGPVSPPESLRMLSDRPVTLCQSGVR